MVKLGRRPLLAIPLATGTPDTTFVQCYPGHTRKKRLVRSLIRATLWSGLARAMWAHCASPIADISALELEAWIEQIRQELGQLQLQPVFVWPADATRGRIYVHWQTPDGEVMAFTKLALDPKNSALIENERKALEQLARMDLKKSQVPQVLAAGELQKLSYLITETAPRDARITNWQRDAPIDEHVREFSGITRRKKASELEDLPWWPPLMEYLNGDSRLVRAARSAAKEGADLCRIHGDLNQTNILRAGKQVWLVDWERSSEAGPCMTDAVCMEVDRLWRLTQQNPTKGLEAFLRKIWNDKGTAHRQQVLLALAFLSMCDFPPALVLFKKWEFTFVDRT